MQNVLRKKIPIIGELELAFEECICPVVAITGTNGKTTTTELTTAMLQGSGVRTMASGNIGLPFATAVRQSNELDVMVLEVSSFQLETIDAFRPHVSVWLNLSPNHLDRYRDMDEYRTAKLRIFMNQTSEDYRGGQCPRKPSPARRRAGSPSAPMFRMRISLCATVSSTTGTSPCSISARPGLPAFTMRKISWPLWASGSPWVWTLRSWPPPPLEYTAPVHRCEFVRELEGVRWINDSKATNLDSLEKAILSQTRPIVLIAGGKDKGFEFDSIAPLVRERVRVAVLIGEMKERIARSWSGVDCRISASLEEAVEVARQAANDGDAVLFSPGTSSFDMFRNYGERGNRFKDAVNALK